MKAAFSSLVPPVLLLRCWQLGLVLCMFDATAQTLYRKQEADGSIGWYDRPVPGSVPVSRKLPSLLASPTGQAGSTAEAPRHSSAQPTNSGAPANSPPHQPVAAPVIEPVQLLPPQAVPVLPHTATLPAVPSQPQEESVPRSAVPPTTRPLPPLLPQATRTQPATPPHPATAEPLLAQATQTQNIPFQTGTPLPLSSWGVHRIPPLQQRVSLSDLAPVVRPAPSLRVSPQTQQQRDLGRLAILEEEMRQEKESLFLLHSRPRPDDKNYVEQLRIHNGNLYAIQQEVTRIQRTMTTVTAPARRR